MDQLRNRRTPSKHDFDARLQFCVVGCDGSSHASRIIERQQKQTDGPATRRRSDSPDMQMSCDMQVVIASGDHGLMKPAGNIKLGHDAALAPGDVRPVGLIAQTRNIAQRIVFFCGHRREQVS
jgi:hypothetical protein